ncbi:MAG: superoxide dismutase family protein [Lachnospiraceae bacterium]|nr:superoxide dismutase family protein [Lachnospiraceae bacterium]
MANSQMTPGSTFQYILSNQMPSAVAWVRGGTAHPAISGLVKFYQTPYQGILVEAEIFNLPGVNQQGSTGFFAMHIHQNGNCANNFANVGPHMGAPGSMHPFHSGDLIPLLANQGYAWTAFYDKRFTIRDILGRSVIIHMNPDDFRTQPSGNSGSMIACGEIRTS